MNRTRTFVVLTLLRTLLLGLTLCGLTHVVRGQTRSLEQGWHNPPRDARLRAYWWWLNGNVTKEAITRDLEQMAAQGMGGALICDADGASQDGNARVPHGPDFFSQEWRELYRHALHEAHRLELEMSLNIQSGWNLGGPMVAIEDAAKKLVWSETLVAGEDSLREPLAQPETRDGYYRDLFVVACRVDETGPAFTRSVQVSASSMQKAFPASGGADGDVNSFWASAGKNAGEGPSEDSPEWLQMSFPETQVTINQVAVLGRSGYGPRACELHVSSDGQQFRVVKRFSVPETRKAVVDVEPVSGVFFRLVMTSAFDQRFPNSPRNVQVAEFSISGPSGTFPEAARDRLLPNWQEKALHRALHFSAPDTSMLVIDQEGGTSRITATATEVMDLTDRLRADGTLDWDVPEGRWIVMRWGCTIGDHSKVSTSSDGWKGYALDVLDKGAFCRYWDQVVEPLIEDAGPLAGKTLKFLHTDSWEVEVVNWTPTLRAEFRRRRGYDLVPYLPVIAGRIIDSESASNRFLNDFRKTVGELAIDNHYQVFRDRAHRHGLLIHPESGGPHAVPVDAQRCLGFNDVPMSEFWARSWRHRIGDENRFFVKQPASAAHTYGRKFVAAEGFTTIGPHWQETLWDNLKPAFDRALCEGLNRLVWHTFTCSPDEMGEPGQEYFAGTHFNPHATWWSRSDAFLAYINRCQWMMQQGLFVADACYYYGDHVPNFAQLKKSDPAHVLPGYDYDVVTEEVLVERMDFRDGRLRLPDGMSYRVLVLPERRTISLPVLRKIRQLVESGATVIGLKPIAATSLSGYPQCDIEVQMLANELWGPEQQLDATGRRFGAGRVFTGTTAREVLQRDGIPADFAYKSSGDDVNLDYIHRRAADADIYFVTNASDQQVAVECTFRTIGKQPELWDPVAGQIREATTWSTVERSCTAIPVTFPPFGSCVFVFRAPAEPPEPGNVKPNSAVVDQLRQISGPWTVRFDTAWGGPGEVQFDELISWTKRPEKGIQYYSGTATYKAEFKLSDEDLQQNLWLDLGRVRELAEVRVNGKSLGIVWAPPFRVTLRDATHSGSNRLEIDVVNFWPNRIIGDQFVPQQQRLTKTNIRHFDKQSPLIESGLFGPVVLLRESGN